MGLPDHDHEFYLSEAFTSLFTSPSCLSMARLLVALGCLCIRRRRSPGPALARGVAVPERDGTSWGTEEHQRR